MNREIKFRVWDKTKKVFIQIHLNSLESMLSGIGSDEGFYFIRTRHNLSGTPRKICNSDIEDCVFQQFTGFKDKNGVEIYEGDIVLIKTCHDTVIFKHGGFTTEIHRWIPNWCEVIGNIFENPELIK